MMYIMMKNETYQGERDLAPRILELQWHIGQPKPSQITPHNGHLVVAVQADGDELNAIIGGCINLPYHPNARVQTWRGELAQFIVDNVVK